MARLRHILGFLGAVSLACASAHAEELPAGITLQPTDAGEVFADSAGNTLYTSQLDDTGVSKCTSKQHRFGTANLRNVDYPLTRQENRPTCIQKLVPVQPPPNAAPTAHWTILERPDGMRQWMYDRRPVYTSVKDNGPGVVNAAYGYLSAPRPLYVPVAVPSGVTVVRPQGGGAYFAVTTNSRPIVVAPRGSRPPSDDWTPLAAPELAAPIGKWTVATGDDGMSRWSYEGQDLYLYTGVDPTPDTLPTGWTVLSLGRRAPLPAEFKTVLTLGGQYGRSGTANVVTTRAGATIYTYSCQEEGPDRLVCDDPSDASPAWISLCGSLERCAQLYRPVVPSKNAQPDGKMWSIVTVSEPWAPVRAADGVKGMKVWAYRGRPVFTFAKDLRTGDTEGERSSTYRRWSAVDGGEY